MHLVAARADFGRATVDRTGLPDAAVDGAASIDALPFAPDRPAALRTELGERAAGNFLLEAQLVLARTEELPPAELLVLRRPPAE